MKRLAFFLLLIINCTCLLCQPRLKKDTTFITPRSFNSTALKELKNDKDFQYNRYHEPALSLWDKFWNWVWWKAGQLLSTKKGRITVWSILILLAVILIVLSVIKITGMDQEGLFGRNSKGLLKYGLSEDDIHNISFDEEIAKAISNLNYRLATRLEYLKALKNLSDKSQIDWQINKTNTDYVFETAGKPFSEMFITLTQKFEHIWYGGQQISREHFFEISSKFQQFNKQV